jgi:hypothetical protein
MSYSKRIQAIAPRTTRGRSTSSHIRHIPALAVPTSSVLPSVDDLTKSRSFCYHTSSRSRTDTDQIIHHERRGQMATAAYPLAHLYQDVHPCAGKLARRLYVRRSDSPVMRVHSVVTKTHVRITYGQHSERPRTKCWYKEDYIPVTLQSYYLLVSPRLS